MVKVHTTVNIDDELKKKAFDGQVELSAALERGIRETLQLKEVIIDESVQKCSICNIEGPKETKDTIKENNPRALTWLWPDEKWICNSCLSRFAAHAKVGQ